MPWMPLAMGGMQHGHKYANQEGVLYGILTMARPRNKEMQTSAHAGMLTDTVGVRFERDASSRTPIGAASARADPGKLEGRARPDGSSGREGFCGDLWMAFAGP